MTISTADTRQAAAPALRAPAALAGLATEFAATSDHIAKAAKRSPFAKLNARWPGILARLRNSRGAKMRRSLDKVAADAAKRASARVAELDGPRPVWLDLIERAHAWAALTATVVTWPPPREQVTHTLVTTVLTAAPPASADRRSHALAA